MSELIEAARAVLRHHESIEEAFETAYPRGPVHDGALCAVADAFRRLDVAIENAGQDLSANPPDMSLVSTDDLIAALRRRHDAGILATVRTLSASTETGYAEWWGGRYAAIGLAEVLIDRIKAEMRDDPAEEVIYE